MTKRFFGTALGIAGLVSAVACSQDSSATKSSLTAPTPASAAARGNGIPAGYKLEFNWNLIGTPKDYQGGCGDGHRIFVNRDINNAHILITDPSGAGQGSGWSIVDCNATGGNLAEMQSDGLGTFVVYARILGKIGGKIHVCAELASDADDLLCELGTIDLERSKGQSKFQFQPNALFDASLENILWTVDTNKEFRIVQFRVYRVPA
jgi:hypothetical protein